MSKLKKNVYYFSLLATIVYLIYRIFYTLPNNNDISIYFALVVLFVELVDSIFFSVYVLNVLTRNNNYIKPSKLLKKDYPDLDIFIATINEDISIVERTIKSCINMKYPNKKKIHIYLCDDGHRNEMKELCKKYNINYITRNNNINAKAGNYNNALKKSNSPYIVTFDADMKPSRDFLIKTIPYLFSYDNIGFIQLPQNFDNGDLFQNRFKLLGYIPLEQDFFYHRIQLSRNNNNSVIFCGTNAILSRVALEDIGGFATETITEDFATGLMMEGHGFKGIALPYDEVYGVNVHDFTSLLKQRSRWCRGCIQTYKNYKIITNKGLNIRQKMDYLSGVYYWFFGIRNMIYLLVPLLYSFFNINIIQGNLLFFIFLFLIQYIIKRFIIDILEKRESSSTWNRIYETILTPVIFVESLLEIFGISKKKFEVTSKKKSNSYNKSLKYIYTMIMHISLFLLNTIGLYISINKGIVYGFINFLVPIFWLGTNSIYLMFALVFDFSNSLDDDKNNALVKNYSLFAIVLVFVNFIVKEIKLKRLVTFMMIILFLIVGININNYYQYQKSIIIKKESLVSYNKWLSVKDGNIINYSGNIVKLKGISTHNLNYYGGLYTRDNIKELRDTWGINTFRLAVYTSPSEEGYVKNKNQMKDIERLIDYCIDLDLYVIVDWHILKDNDPGTYKEEAIEFFDYISKKYRNSPNIIYEICNEPNGDEVTWDNTIKPYAEEIINVIRNNSKKSLIIVGLANWCKDIESAENNLLSDKNTLYAVHLYSGDNDLINVKKQMNKAIKRKMPLIVTETGATDETGSGRLYTSEFNDWIEYLDNNNVGWIIWQLSDKNETSSLVTEKEVEDRIDYVYGTYTKKELRTKKYHINDYLTVTGEYMKYIFKKYN